MMIMLTDPRGKLMLLAGAVVEALGIFVMRRMINFKYLARREGHGFQRTGDDLTDPSTILMGFVGVLTFATIVTLASPLLVRSTLETRLNSVANRREELKRRSREALAKKNQAASIRQTDEGMFKTIVDRLQLSRLLEDPQVADKLAQAGYRGPRPITTFYFFRMITPFVFALVLGIYLYMLNRFNLPGLTKLCICVGGLTAGYYAPNVYISNVAAKRRTSIMQAFPDALDLLLICVESGMSIEAALQKVSQELGALVDRVGRRTVAAGRRAVLPARPPAGLRGPGQAHQPSGHQVRRHRHDPG